MSRTETYERRRPDGSVAVITRDIDTGKQDIVIKDEAKQPAPEKQLEEQTGATSRVGYPQGEPSEDWTVPQLRAYVRARGIDLDGARTKPDILAVILTAGEDDDPEDDQDDDDQDDLDDDDLDDDELEENELADGGLDEDQEDEDGAPSDAAESDSPVEGE